MEGIIQHINDINRNTIFDYNKFKKVDKFLSSDSFKGIEYLDHGGTVLCYVLHDTVYKICQHDRLNKSKLVSAIGTLVKQCLNVLPIECIYDDENCFIYTQKRVKTVLFDDINRKFCRDILKIVRKMFEIKYIFPDLHFRNFGYYMGRCYLFDCHEENTYDLVESKFFVYNLYVMLMILHHLPYVGDLDSANAVNFGLDSLPKPFPFVLKELYQHHYDVTLIDQCITAVVT